MKQKISSSNNNNQYNNRKVYFIKNNKNINQSEENIYDR